MGGGAAAGAAVVHIAPARAEPVPPGATTLPYPSKPLAAANTLRENTPVDFAYPDENSPCVLIKTGRAVPGGVGPNQDIVAYSMLCTHMGCPVAYDAQARTFKCPCHFSIFDPERSGQQVIGQATENLPQIELAYDRQSGTITAVGVHGLIYGRQANVL
jgi:arsenite oxidase small subunit